MTTHSSNVRKLLVSLAALLALAGCATESSIDGDGDTHRNDGDPSSIDIRRGRVLASLMRADSCDDLLEQIQDDVAAKIELQADSRS